MDRETQPEYLLVATATDGGGLSCQAKVKVMLRDVNDNAPAFPEGALREAYSVSEDAEVNTLITRLVAHDPDTGTSTPARKL